ncbi:MAG: hypothetical protein VYA34_14090 [Myxococcota bacterium]|nr:hypothetical protein [Myxococcota bacterium]
MSVSRQLGSLVIIDYVVGAAVDVLRIHAPAMAALLSAIISFALVTDDSVLVP